VAALDEDALEQRLYPPPRRRAATGSTARPLPDWTRIREELPGVTTRSR